MSLITNVQKMFNEGQKRGYQNSSDAFIMPIFGSINIPNECFHYCFSTSVCMLGTHQPRRHKT